jgi:hypothetical protein
VMHPADALSLVIFGGMCLAVILRVKGGSR